jgi:hypothetical protein
MPTYILLTYEMQWWPRLLRPYPQLMVAVLPQTHIVFSLN